MASRPPSSLSERLGPFVVMPSSIQVVVRLDSAAFRLAPLPYLLTHFSDVRLSVACSVLPDPGHAYGTSATPLEEREGADEDLV